MQDPDRKQAIEQFHAVHPNIGFDHDIHIIVDDLNIEDHWIIKAIQRIAVDMIGGEDNEWKRKKLSFLVWLLNLPMPDGWDEE